MADVLDYLGEDGILRSLLTKMLKGKPVAMYPQTSSEVVKYKESSVEATLTELLKNHSNLSTLAKNTSKSLSSLTEDTYRKKYIDIAVNTLLEKLSDVNVSITNILIAIHSLDMYEKEDIDQKVYNLTATISGLDTLLSTRIESFLTYLTSNYDDKAAMDAKVDECLLEISEYQKNIDLNFRELILQMKAEFGDLFNQRFETFYKKEEVDALIEEYYDKVSTIRGDYTAMNSKAVSDINAYLIGTKKALEQTHQDQLEVSDINLKAHMDENKNDIQNSIKALADQLGDLQSAIAVNNSSYPSADEEAF